MLDDRLEPDQHVTVDQSFPYASSLLEHMSCRLSKTSGGRVLTKHPIYIYVSMPG